MAEGERFELSIRFHVCWFSRPVHSTALPTLHKYHLKIAFLGGSLIHRRRAWAQFAKIDFYRKAPGGKPVITSAG